MRSRAPSQSQQTRYLGQRLDQTKYRECISVLETVAARSYHCRAGNTFEQCIRDLGPYGANQASAQQIAGRLTSNQSDSHIS
jgi:hypothetical protein